MSRPLGLYVHVPFCRTRCRYCDFYRVGENRERMVLFLEALRRDIESARDDRGRRVDTLYLGGGTPSLLTPEQVAALIGRLKDRFRVLEHAEVTLEANPSDLSPARLAGYRTAGVNRLSLGGQSFSDRELRLLGRRHDARRVEQSIVWARQAGFDNLSLDLMLGIPGQTEAAFGRSLERALAARPDHISAYILEIHPGSEIDGLRRTRPALFPSETVQRRRYERMARRLDEAGFRHYEISSFARPGHESRHNLKYWRLEPYLGFGPSAHSYAGGRRWRRPPSLTAYLRDPTAVEELGLDSLQERLFLGLRLREGMDESAVASCLEISCDELRRRADSLAPYVELTGGRVKLTLDGILVSTSVLAELMWAPAEAKPMGVKP